MRRSDREITDLKEIMDVMQKCDTCRLGLQDEKVPYIVPLNFGVREENGRITLFFHSAPEGKKIRLMEQNGAAGFEMDTAHVLIESDTACGYGMNYKCVLGVGTLSFIEDYEEKKENLYSGRCTVNSDGSYCIYCALCVYAGKCLKGEAGG